MSSSELEYVDRLRHAAGEGISVTDILRSGLALVGERLGVPYQGGQS